MLHITITRDEILFFYSAYIQNSANERKQNESAEKLHLWLKLDLKKTMCNIQYKIKVIEIKAEIFIELVLITQTAMLDTRYYSFMRLGD